MTDEKASTVTDIGQEEEMSRLSKLEERVARIDESAYIRLPPKVTSTSWGTVIPYRDIFQVGEVLLMLLNDLGYDLEKILESVRLVKKEADDD